MTVNTPGPALRASDAERDAVATELGEHFRAGRLDLTEFDDRLGRALRARTRNDLDELLADLPRQDPGPARPARSGRRAWPALVVAVPAIVVAAAAIAGGAAGGHPYWFPWWLIPITIFALRRMWWRQRTTARNAR